MSDGKNYIYVDAHYEHPTTKRRMKWLRMATSEVDRLIVEPANRANCFTSVQRYQEAISLRDQEAASPAGGDKNGEAENASAPDQTDDLPDQQLHYNGLFFDFDCDCTKLGISENEALSRSLADARTLADWFIQTFDPNPAHVQAWFSGKKGFHLMVRPELFDITPHRHLTYIIKNIAIQLKDELDLQTLDTSVYTNRGRMWRIPNTVHPSTGRFKIELRLHELANWDVPTILKQSRGPRNDTENTEALPNSHLFEFVEYREIRPDPDAMKWWREFVELYEIRHDMKRLRPQKKIERPSGSQKLPACMQDMMDNGPKPTGPNRNRVLLPIVGFFRDAGMDRHEAHKQVKDWTEKFYPEQSQLRQRLQNGRTVVESAYRGSLRFACRAILGNGGTSADERVACVGYENCPWIQDPADQDPEETPTVHLSDATKGCYMNTVVRTPIHVAAIAGHPFDLPIRGRIECGMNAGDKLCGDCPNGPKGGRGAMGWKFDAEDDLVLELINVNKNQRKGTIKARCKIPKNCFKHKIKVLEHSNLEELQIIPMVDYAQVYMEDNAKEDAMAKSYRHVVRRAFHLGHNIQANKKYMIEASVFAYPKDQRVCLLFDKAEPAQNDIDQFRMTPERYQNLLAFQRRQGQSVEDKLLDIHRDLMVNVHRIGGRFDLSVAIDLCYHSVIGFTFAQDFIHKGWFELLILGDTASGKSQMTTRLLAHYGLGEVIAGEDSKRTGLVYASIQMQGQWILRWGKIPQNDRRLLVIDEFSGIPQEEVSKMTQLRSEGKARGGGVNSDYETWARTRLILLTNPSKNRGSVAGHNYGILAVRAMFKDDPDLRRVDLAIVAEKDDVESSMINKRWDKISLPHRYTTDLCRNMVLWAWSREPRDVEWCAGAEDEVIVWAERLGDTYECDIPLAERADLRLKIARISAAVAARLFSTDTDARKVLVEVDHVQFAGRFIDRSYRKRAMAYFEYARKYKRDNHFTERKRQLIKDELSSYGDEEDASDLVSILLDVDLITKPTLIDMVNLEPDDLKKLWKFLVGQRLIRRITKGYRKSPAFTKLLHILSATESQYAGELSPDFETGGKFGYNGTNGAKPRPEPEPPAPEPEFSEEMFDSEEDLETGPPDDDDEVPF